MLDYHPAPDRACNPFLGVSRGIPCGGCERPFQPTRRNQRYCDPSCRGLAFRRRRDHGGGARGDRDGMVCGPFE
jgi:hypothetical protein